MNVGEDASDELRALRARAYGPGADISSDPDALRRLAELEARTRAPLAETERELASPPEQAPPPSPIPEPVEPASAARPRRTRVRVALLVAAAVVLTAVVASAATLSLTDDGPPRVATLAAVPDAEWPAQFPGADVGDAAVFETFEGMTVVSMQRGIRGPGSDAMCLYLVGGAPLYPTMMCSVGEFPATTVVLVGGDSPEPLRKRFRDGTALQFVLDGGAVQVYAIEPTPAPAG